MTLVITTDEKSQPSIVFDDLVEDNLYHNPNFLNRIVLVTNVDFDDDEDDVLVRYVEFNIKTGSVATGQISAWKLESTHWVKYNDSLTIKNAVEDAY